MFARENKGKRQRRRGLSEGQLAALLVAPALLVIACIAIYPILRTGWYSVFDLRLNHPTRNDTVLSYSLDLEKYADGMLTINAQLGKAEVKLEGTVQTAVMEMRDEIAAYEAVLFAQDDRASQLSQVNALLDQYLPVQNKELRYLPVTEKEITDYRAHIQTISEALTALTANDTPAAKEIAKALQALDTLSFAIVEPNYVGLSNYIRYFSDSRLWASVANTSIFTVCAVFFELLMGTLLALLMNQRFPGRGLVRASILIPWSIPASTSATIWKFMYDGQYGIMSKLFTAIGIIPSAAYILTTREGSLFGMIVSDIWKTTPFMALLLLAGLQTIDGTLYEAARVDGCGAFRRFWSITLPLLKPTILVAMLFRTLDTFKAFDLMSVMTYGANNTESISLYAYKTMFAQMEFGNGSALSIVLFFMVMLICIFYIKVLGTDLFKSSKA